MAEYKEALGRINAIDHGERADRRPAQTPVRAGAFCAIIWNHLNLSNGVAFSYVCAKEMLGPFNGRGMQLVARGTSFPPVGSSGSADAAVPPAQFAFLTLG
jgi:hypothetical protein